MLHSINHSRFAYLTALFITALLLGLVLAPATGSSAQELLPLPPACGAKINLSNTLYHGDSQPGIEADTVVWGGMAPDISTSEIWAYDIVSGVKTNLSNTDIFSDGGPEIGGGVVVWHGYFDVDASMEIWAYDLTTGIKSNVSQSFATFDNYPQTNGIYAVWAGDPMGTLRDEIYATELSTGVKTNLSNTYDLSDWSPKIDGNHVIWHGWAPGSTNSDIWLYDLPTGVKTNLSNTGSYPESNPAIEGDIIVWEAVPYGNSKAEIVMYNLTTGEQVYLTNSLGAYDMQPKIHGGKIVWTTQSVDRTAADIWLYDVVTGVKMNVSQTPEYRDGSPDVFGDIVVWSGVTDATGDYEILAYNLVTNERVNLSNNPYGDDFDPHIVSDRVVWSGSPPGSSLSDIFLVTDVASCFSSPPEIVTQPEDTTVFSGETATLSVVAAGDTPLRYQWYFGESGNDSNPIADAKHAEYTTPPLTLTTAYWVRVESPFGSVDSQTATITVEGDAPLIITEPEDITVLIDETATLTVAAEGTEPLTFQWFVGESGDDSEPIAGAVADVYNTEPLTETTSYWVRVENPFGMAESQTVTVIVEPLQLLINPGFEYDVNGDKVPDGWKLSNATKDKIKCNKVKPDGTMKIKAYEGDCAFMFKGGLNEHSKLKQVIVPDPMSIVPADVLLLDVYMKGKTDAVRGVIKLKVVYNNPALDASRARLNMMETADYEPCDPPLSVTILGTVQKIKVIMKHRSPASKVFLDALDLHVEASTTPVSLEEPLLPLPNIRR